jgi:hypothetical protein
MSGTDSFTPAEWPATAAVSVVLTNGRRPHSAARAMRNPVAREAVARPRRRREVHHGEEVEEVEEGQEEQEEEVISGGAVPDFRAAPLFFRAG